MKTLTEKQLGDLVAAAPFSHDLDMDGLLGSKKNAPTRMMRNGAFKVVIELANLCTDVSLRLWLWKQIGLEPKMVIEIAEQMEEQPPGEAEAEPKRQPEGLAQCWMALVGEDR